MGDAMLAGRRERPVDKGLTRWALVPVLGVGEYQAADLGEERLIALRR